MHASDVQEGRLYFQNPENLSESTISPPKSLKSKKEDFLISKDYIFRYFFRLSSFDYRIATLYYLHALTQGQIAKILGTTQAAICRRLKFIMSRVKFLIKKPTLNPLQVRADFLRLFPPSLFEFAYLFYFELTQNRVKFYIQSSQSGARNKLLSIVSYLEGLVEEYEACGEVAILGSRRELYHLAYIYKSYFQYIKENTNVITYLYKKNDIVRRGFIYKGHVQY